MFDTRNTEAIDSVVATLSNGHLLRYDCERAEQSPTSRFEEAMAGYLAVPRCVAVNSGGSGLQLVLEALGIGPGDEVLVPAFTFIAVPSAVVHAGARPRLVECTTDLTIDCDALESSITPATRALLLSYMRGRVPDLDRVLDICGRRGIELIEDAAYAFGVRWRGHPVGTLGRAGVIAFHTVVNSGEGAVVVTADDDLADRVLVAAGCYDENWRKHPGSDARTSELRALANALPVHSMRMGNVIASLLEPQLARAEARIAEMVRRHDYLAQQLAGGPQIRIPRVPPSARHVPWSFQLTLEGLDEAGADRFMAATAARRVPMKVIGRDPGNSRCWWNWSFLDPEPCPRTRAVLERTVDFLLPEDWDNTRLFLLAQTILDAADLATR
jgi:dTDP-4-amino-4,6-dideoxygalactose transaminase